MTKIATDSDTVTLAGDMINTVKRPAKMLRELERESKTSQTYLNVDPDISPETLLRRSVLNGHVRGDDLAMSELSQLASMAKGYTAADEFNFGSNRVFLFLKRGNLSRAWYEYESLDKLLKDKKERLLLDMVSISQIISEQTTTELVDQIRNDRLLAAASKRKISAKRHDGADLYDQLQEIIAESPALANVLDSIFRNVLLQQDPKKKLSQRDMREIVVGNPPLLELFKRMHREIIGETNLRRAILHTMRGALMEADGEYAFAFRAFLKAQNIWSGVKPKTAPSKEASRSWKLENDFRMLKVMSRLYLKMRKRHMQPEAREKFLELRRILVRSLVGSKRKIVEHNTIEIVSLFPGQSQKKTATVRVPGADSAVVRFRARLMSVGVAGIAVDQLIAA